MRSGVVRTVGALDCCLQISCFLSIFYFSYQHQTVELVTDKSAFAPPPTWHYSKGSATPGPQLRLLTGQLAAVPPELPSVLRARFWVLKALRDLPGTCAPSEGPPVEQGGWACASRLLSLWWWVCRTPGSRPCGLWKAAGLHVLWCPR